MPEGKIIPVAEGEYPELQNLPEGSKVSFEGQATLVEGGLQIDSIDLQVENEATRELKMMTKNDDGMMREKKVSGF